MNRALPLSISILLAASPARALCPDAAVLIPTAVVHLGHGTAPPWADHVETIHAFCIDRDEFTNERYQRCRASGACFAMRPHPPSGPMSDVSALEAEVHCQAFGGHLPTEAQWEYAARGPDARPYPWGPEELSDTTPPFWPDDQALMSRPAPFGLLQMHRGLQEWTSTPTGPADAPRRIVKGSPRFILALWSRDFVDERTRSPNLGFRCVYPLGTKPP